MIKVNKDALIEYERLKQKDFFYTLKNTISDVPLTILFHNVRPLSRHHVDDIVSDDRTINNGITEFAEIQINLKLYLISLNIHFNNNRNKFLFLA